MSDAIANLLASRFIARKDVKAIQYSNGAYSPHQEYNPETRKHDGPRIPWSRRDLNSHLEGSSTFGHYLLDPEDQVKLFAFDIDLEKNVLDENDPDKNFVGKYPDKETGEIFEFDAREAWHDRAHPSRYWSKYQLRMVSHQLARAVTEELSLPCAVAYSGGKGVHVYAFTGLVPAADAREGAAIVLDILGGWEPARGDNFFRSVDRDPTTGFPNLSIEVFPKQDSLAGKDLGNLMRLPLGRNLKSKDPTFFVDMTAPMGQLAPLDPEFALTVADPWKKISE